MFIFLLIFIAIIIGGIFFLNNNVQWLGIMMITCFTPCILGLAYCCSSCIYQCMQKRKNEEAFKLIKEFFQDYNTNRFAERGISVQLERKHAEFSYIIFKLGNVPTVTTTVNAPAEPAPMFAK